MSNIDDLINLAASTEDQTITKEGGDFEYQIPPAGATLGRLIEYIELGKQPQRPYQGKDKPDAEEVRLTFELLGPKHINEIEVEGEKRKVSNIISFKVAKKFGDRAKFKKIFNKLTYGRADHKHMAQCLGEPYLLTVYHNEVGEGSDKKTYANLNDKDGNYGIAAPMITDPLTQNVTDLKDKCPASLRSRKVFLWDHPTQETWSSLFIDGTREVKDNKGNVTQESKNWLQELILSASNFSGSPLDTMLSGVSASDITAAEQEAEDLPEENVKEEAKPVEAKQGVDPLAELGLV